MTKEKKIIKNKNKNLKLTNKKKQEFDILYFSLIGTYIEIIESLNKNQINICGTIIFESANLFFIKTKTKIVKILKNNIKIKFKKNNKTIILDCNCLKGNLKTRIKKIK